MKKRKSRIRRKKGGNEKRKTAATNRAWHRKTEKRIAGKGATKKTKKINRGERKKRGR